VALQLLYQLDLNPRAEWAGLAAFAHERLDDPAESEPFCLALVEGVQRHKPDIDRRLGEAAENWKLHRMTAVDRNVLRLGAFELLHRGEDTPAKVALDEAIELARRYGSAESPAFVNGVLDRLRQNAGVAV
jgi:N utilization substance protein B